MVFQDVHLTGVRQVVITTESKSVSLGVGSKPSDNVFAVYRSILTRSSDCAETM
jgi:hypothetical protein